MNTRERILSIVLIVAMVAIAGGFIGWQMIYKPIKNHNENIAKLRDEVDELSEKRLKIEFDQHIYETKTRKKSLPAELKVARLQYEKFLDRMLREAKLTVTSLNPSEPDTKNVPLISGKKPIYTKLDFVVSVKGELPSIVQFLYTFYSQPLLQQIRKVIILKPSTEKGRILDVTMTIEALVLDRAENRSLLLVPHPAIMLAIGGAGAASFSIHNVESGQGTPFIAANVLARGSDRSSTVSSRAEYGRIENKNIFFDPPKYDSKADPKLDKPMVVEEPRGPKEPDLAPFLAITRISHSDGRSVAQIFDRVYKDEYDVEMNSRGEVKVSHYFYELMENTNGTRNEVRKKYPDTTYLQFGSKETGNLRRYVVHRILENELLLETYDPDFERIIQGPAALAFGGAASIGIPGKLHLWRVGQKLVSDEPGKAMRDMTMYWTKQEALTRPLGIENEGDAEIKLGDGGVPDPKKPEAKGSTRKRSSNRD
ncbi:MAG: hypothetical protein K8T89_10575 [Planctomycetes bacterium]|nr:hypothetical protein [Planctomycetota bacterium]